MRKTSGMYLMPLPRGYQVCVSWLPGVRVYITVTRFGYWKVVWLMSHWIRYRPLIVKNFYVIILV